MLFSPYEYHCVYEVSLEPIDFTMIFALTHTRKRNDLSFSYSRKCGIIVIY
jgi:hypothetical protein